VSYSIYIASPLGFTPYGMASQRALVDSVRERGYKPLDPWAPTANQFTAALALEDPTERATALASANRKTGRRNERLIRGADGLLAVLDGADVDSGTAAEVGFAAALGLPIVGVRTDLRLTGDNSSAIVNLQVEYFIRLTGGDTYRDFEAAFVGLDRLFRRRRQSRAASRNRPPMGDCT
jgi:nucleoside 2-deoxyribosyltransferase